MTKLTNEDVLYYANFARVALKEQEVDTLKEELTKMIDYASVLKEANVEGISPMTHPLQRVNVMREDVVQDVLDRDEMLKNVELHEAGMIKVPNTFE